MKYAHTRNNTLIDVSEVKYLDDDIQNIEISEELYNAVMAEPEKYNYDNGKIIENPDYEQQQAAEERARLNMLSLTKADVLLALYEDKGLTPEDIKAMLKDNVPALIKFDYASSYYRGDEVVNALGLALGYTTEEMDYLFTNKKFPTTEETSVTDDVNIENEE